MPRGDGTGPAGMGPMTGRAAGYCAGYSVPGFMNPIGGRGYGGWGRGRGGGGGGGWGRGYGRGFGWAGAGYGYPAWGGAVAPYFSAGVSQVTAQQELDGLKQQADYFKDALDEINKRIGQLEAESEK